LGELRAITQLNRLRLMQIDREDDRKPVPRIDPRRAGTIETMPDELFEEFMKAVAAYEANDDET